MINDNHDKNITFHRNVIFKAGLFRLCRIEQMKGNYIPYEPPIVTLVWEKLHGYSCMKEPVWIGITIDLEHRELVKTLTECIAESKTLQGLSKGMDIGVPKEQLGGAFEKLGEELQIRRISP